MLDLKFIREKIKVVEKAIKDKGESVDITRFEELDKNRRKFIEIRDAARFNRKQLSSSVAKKKHSKKSVLFEPETMRSWQEFLETWQESAQALMSLEKQCQAAGQALMSWREQWQAVAQALMAWGQRWQASAQVGEVWRANLEAIHEGAKSYANAVKVIEPMVRTIQDEIEKISAGIPNIPHPTVPEGDRNLIIREWGRKRKFSFEPLNCVNLCNSLGILDFERGSKVAGSNFPCYKGLGARLERALINFMIDLHIKHGYTEIFPPFLANRDSMFSTGQLPKMEEDMYFFEKEGLFLNPTAEVPLTSLHMNEVLKEEDLPIKYVGYTACFRREAGAYGKKTRGLKRVHQFNKVELVKFASPRDSYEELESLLGDAERVLKLLNIPYRVSLLSTKEMSFASAKTYDIEAWAPVTEEYLEVSSATNFEDFQARRGNIRYREKRGKAHLVHTLNASGVATPRTFMALVENCQQKDGSIRIPDALIPYMGGINEIS